MIPGRPTWLTARTQHGTVMGQASAGRLRQDDTMVDIDNKGPLQPVALGEALTSISRALHKEGAHGSWREARRVHRDCRLVAGLRAQPLDDGTQSLLQGCLVEPMGEAVDGGIVGRTPQPQGGPQFCVFGQPNFGFTKGPILIAHPAQNGQQLGLRKLTL
jgi:hypothetical protein